MKSLGLCYWLRLRQLRRCRNRVACPHTGTDKECCRVRRRGETTRLLINRSYQSHQLISPSPRPKCLSRARVGE
ncbi:Uncharacterized protein HZ326_28504 [Fusarium oxysporum f. sp. albedinis]|nr:Uncharacterized protein HZ326_28504 [Fusarium oxysporum f. sp. albedinis]